MGSCIPEAWRLRPTDRQNFFLFGPRGTGKTTWLTQRFPDALYLDLLDQPGCTSTYWRGPSACAS